MNSCTLACDTLRTDADDGDECVHCGRVYPDPARRHMYIATTPTHTVRELARTPTSRYLPPHRQPGWFHVVQMNGHGTGLDKRAGRR